jgi:hypothetical protein
MAVNESVRGRAEMLRHPLSVSLHFSLALEKAYLAMLI